MMAMNKRTPEGDVLTDIILESFRLNGALLEAGNQLTKPFQLTSARWQVMGPVSEQALTVAQVARRMGLARQGVQRIVNDLERLEMVTFESNPDHKRAPLIAISKKGQAAMEEINVAQSAWVNELADGLSERQLNQTLKVLQSVRERTEET
jgi:DNA-binding MarR family transcriptional regulator